MNRLEVPVHGFEWVDALAFVRSPGRQHTNHPGRWLIPKERTAQPAYGCIDLDAESALYRDFINLQPTEDAIGKFANLFGQLGVNTVSVSVATSHKSAEDSVLMLNAESLEMWRTEIQDLSHVFRCWERVCAEDRAWLAQYFRVVAGPGSDELVHERADSVAFGEIILASESANPETLRKFKTGQVVDAVADALPSLINHKMAYHPMYAQLTRKRGTRSSGSKPLYELGVVSRNLISAIWLQLGTAIADGRKPRLCQACPKWFTLTGSRRGDAKFCSDACRARAYRTRMVEAVRLHHAGTLPKTIAKLLETDEKTVKGWIKG